MADTELYPRPLPDLTEDDRPDVSLVVPVFNEERTIEQVVAQAIEVLEGDSRTFEVIVVDDGSRDATWATIERLHARDARVKAVRFKRNFGQHPAMHAGLVRARGDIVVTMDGDLQNQPSDLPKLIGAVANGADVASGRRKGREDSWGRTLPSKLINGMLRRFTSADITDFGCAYNAYSRDALTPVLGVIGKQKFTKALVLAAAESHVEKSIEEGASEFVTTNVEGTQILLDAIRRTSVERFILFSSSEVYGTAECAPMHEEHPLNPRSPYAATKAGSDRLAYSYFVTYGLPITIVRPFNNYGPHQHPEKVVPRFITQALKDEPLTVHGDGHASRDWVFVEDVAEAIDAVIESDVDAVAGEVVNIATGRDISVEEIADLVLERLGKPASLKVHTPERRGQVDRHIGSTDKAQKLLGWRARTSFEEGLERTIGWYDENRAWWESPLRSDSAVFSS